MQVAFGLRPSGLNPHSEAVMKAHIGLYVNEFSVELGEKGRAAVRSMFGMAVEREIISKFNSEIFTN